MTTSNNETSSFLSSVFEALSYTSVCYGVIYRWYLTMQLVSIILPEWDRDVSEATERRGQPHHLGLSRLTKGSCNCLSRATDSTAAVNVSGYNGRSFSDRAEGPEVERSLWRWQLLVLTGAVRSAPSQALFGLSSGFLLPLPPCVSCPSRHEQSDCCNNCLEKLCCVQISVYIRGASLLTVWLL